MTNDEQNHPLRQPLTLPCGVTLENRLVKSAMSDSLGDGRGNATDAQARLYQRWAEGGVGLSIIGEVQVDERYPEKPGNLVVDSKTDVDALRALARAGSVNGTALWAQLGHAGALADPLLSDARGPSRLEIGDFRCEALSPSDIAALPTRFADAATMLKDCGVGGVEIHAGHGFLLSQFLSPLFNHRTDNYGGDVADRVRIVVEIIDAVRKGVGPHYPIGIKFNSSDGLEGGLTEEDALVAVSHLNATSLDVIGISGGTYFPGAVPASDSGGSGPYFLSFAERARERTDKPILVTGGFKQEVEVRDAVAGGAADLVGLGRALVIDPVLPARWCASSRQVGDSDPVFPRFASTPPGGVTAWYTMRLTALADGVEEGVSLDLGEAVREYEGRDELRRAGWRGQGGLL